MGSGGVEVASLSHALPHMPPLLRLLLAAAALSCSVRPGARRCGVYAFMTEEKARARQQVTDLAGTEVRMRLGPLA